MRDDLSNREIEELENSQKQMFDVFKKNQHGIMFSVNSLPDPETHTVNECFRLPLMCLAKRVNTHMMAVVYKCIRDMLLERTSEEFITALDEAHGHVIQAAFPDGDVDFDHLQQLSNADMNKPQ